MIICCTTCKKRFQQTHDNQRKCSKDCYKKIEYPENKHKNYTYYLYSVKRYFQNPFYQFFRMFHEEHLNIEMRMKNREMEKYLKIWK